MKVNIIETLRELRGVKKKSEETSKVVDDMICQYEIMVGLVLKDAFKEEKIRDSYAREDFFELDGGTIDIIIHSLGLDIDIDNYDCSDKEELERLHWILVEKLSGINLTNLDDEDEEESIFDDYEEEEEEIKKIGFWKAGTATEVKRHIDEEWYGSKEYEAVIRYMNNTRAGRHYKGWSTCQICKKRNGSCDMYSPDSIWIFPEGYIHYIVDHKVKPDNPKFISDAIAWVKKQKKKSGPPRQRPKVKGRRKKAPKHL
jgi:hypothetical protein